MTAVWHRGQARALRLLVPLSGVLEGWWWCPAGCRGHTPADALAPWRAWPTTAASPIRMWLSFVTPTWNSMSTLTSARCEAMRMCVMAGAAGLAGWLERLSFAPSNFFVV